MPTADSQSEIEAFLHARGASLVGVADLRQLEGIFTAPQALLAQYHTGISIGISLERYGGYNNSTERQAFGFLRKTASALQAYVQARGYAAQVIAPDRRVARTGPLHWWGELSHKAVARAAGLGWIGKSTLLVTPQFGPRVSLVTVLSDMEMATGEPIANLCGECTRCVDACDRRALQPARFEDYPARPQDALHIEVCGPWIAEAWQAGTHCYDCMLACPWGQASARKMTPEAGHRP